MHILVAKRLLVTIRSRLRTAMAQKQLIVNKAKLCSKGFAVNGLSGKKDRHYNLTPSSVAVAQKQFIVSEAKLCSKGFAINGLSGKQRCLGRLSLALDS